MNTRSLTLATLALCAAQLLRAQSDQPKPSAHDHAPLDQTAPTAKSKPDQNQNQTVPPVAPSSQPSATEKSAPQQHAQPPAAAANTPNPAAAPSAPRANIQLAADDAKTRTAKRFIGWRVKSSERDELGKVKDFLVDTQTGKAEFAVISSGGVAGIGNKLRLVPATALKRLGESNDFMLEIQKNRWDSVATVDENELKSGRLTIADSQRREIDRHFQHSTNAAQDTGAAYSAGLTAHLVSASELDDRSVRSGNDKLGKIEDVVLDLDSGMAQALISPEKDFTGLKDKLLVPFSALTIGEGKRPQVSTLLSRADFQPLRSGSPIVATSATATPPSGAVAAATQPQQPRETASPDSEKTNVTAGAATTEQSQNIASSTPSASQQPSPTGRMESQQKASKDTQVAATEQSAGSAAAKSPDQPKQIASSDTQQNNSEAKHADTGAAAENRTEKSAVASNDTGSSKNAELAQDKSADRSGRVAQADRSAANKDENLTPTGKNSEDTIPAGTDPALLATARAIRKALDGDEALRSADVRVTPEDGKIVLRGRVSDQKTKTAILETATREVKGWKFDDQISVDNR